MTDTTATQKPRPVFRNIHVTQIIKYRLPPAGMVSIGHRISGVMMFLLLPFVVWLFDVTLTSEVSYGQFSSAYTAGLGIFPAWIVKLVTLGLIWAFLHHFVAGLRHLWMDATHAVTKEFGRVSALVTLGISLLLTLVLGFKLFF
jgi:succinate dehydrogenase / fumarate reductase cytochrome b subunit